MDATVCPDEVRLELNSYCAAQKARERSEEEIWKSWKKNDPYAHLRSLCGTHVYTCETKRNLLGPLAVLAFPILLAVTLSITGVRWPGFVAAHPWWFVCVVLPVGTIITCVFADWFAIVAAKCYAKVVFSCCKECRKKYCDTYLLKQEKKRGLCRKVVDIIIRDWDSVWVREAHGMNEGMVLAQLYLDWDDYDERVMVKDIFCEIAKFVPGFVADEVGKFPDPRTYRLTYNPVSASKT